MKKLAWMALGLGLISASAAQAFNFTPSFGWSSPNMNWGSNPSWSTGPNMGWGFQPSWNTWSWSYNPNMSWGNMPYNNMNYMYWSGYNYPNQPYSSWSSMNMSMPQMNQAPYYMPYPPAPMNLPMQPAPLPQATEPTSSAPAMQMQANAPVVNPVAAPLVQQAPAPAAVHVQASTTTTNNGAVFPSAADVPADMTANSTTSKPAQ